MDISFRINIWVTVVYLLYCSHGITTALEEKNMEGCKIELADASEMIPKLNSILEKAKLVEYKIEFVPFSNTTDVSNNGDVTSADIHDITTSDGTHNYNIYDWKRVLSRHGQALLSLPFNYKVLSLFQLSPGVVDVQVKLHDKPSGCFLNFTADEKLKTLRDLVMCDFQPPPHGQMIRLAKGNQVCHNVIKSKDNKIAEFLYKCCSISERTNAVECMDQGQGKWFKLLFDVIPNMEIIFFLFFPLFVLGALSKRSFRTTDYIVKLKEPDEAVVQKTNQNVELNTIRRKKQDKLKGEKSRFLNNNENTNVSKRKCVEDLKTIPWNKPTKVKLPILHILVDHKKLMAENNVSVGVRQFIWDNVFMCRIRNEYPFSACCRQSMFGSWNKNFLCCLLPQNNGFISMMNRLNLKYRRYISWENIFRFFSFLSVTIFIPFPYYCEVIIYKYFMEDEFTNRIAASNALGLSINSPFPPYQRFIPFIILHVVALVLYFLTSIFLLILHLRDSFYFLEYLVSILRDFKHLERVETFRMLALHIVLPFQEFGLLGFVIGPFIWIFTIPFALITIVYYCIPTFYLIGRLLFLRKPNCVKKLMFSRRAYDKKHIESLEEEAQRADGSDTDDLDNLEKLFLIQRISPNDETFLPLRPLKKDGTLKTKGTVGYTDCKKRLIGIILTIYMLSLLTLYSNFFGFLIEVVTLTFMGAVANAGSTGQYFFFVFFLFTYTRTVLNKVHDKYQTMASELFSHIKDKLDTDISNAVIIRDKEQRNFAFKFFSKEELKELNKNRQLQTISTDENGFANVYRDRFETKDKQLQLSLNSVVLFLDKYDRPRIPKKLFFDICQIDCPGCPGPIYKSLLLAMKELAYLVFFLFFVVIIVLAFSDTYEISSTNQLLLTVVGGFAPFIIRVVMKPKVLHLNLSTYSFKGKVHEIISDYRESWPVYDIEFLKEDKKADTLTQNECADVTGNPSKDNKGDEGHTEGVISDEYTVTPEVKQELASPKPHLETTKSVHSEVMFDANSGRSNLCRFEPNVDGIDLMFHMRMIGDDEEEEDMFV